MRSVKASLVAPPGRRAWLSVSAAIVLPLVAAVILVPFRAHFANAAAALLLAAVIVGVASRGDRWAGWIASVSSAVWFDFFLTRPYERLSIAAASDIETTVALLVVGLAVTEIAVRSRRLYTVAWAEGNYLALLRDLSDLVATGASADEVVATARDDLTELLCLSRCRFEPAVPRNHRPRLLRNGEIEVGDVRFDVAARGLPEGEIELITESSGREYGMFVMEAGEHRPVSVEQRVVALAIADQVGAALAAPRAA